MESQFGLAGWLVVLLATIASSCRCGAGSSGRELVVQSPMARSCEALLTISSDPAPEIDFGKSAKGAVQRKDKKLGLAFVATADTSLQEPVRFTWSSMSPGDQTLELVHATCYDRLGRLLPGEGLSLKGR